MGAARQGRAMGRQRQGPPARGWSSSRSGAAIGLSHDIGHLGSEPIPHRNRLKNLCFAGQSVGHPGVVGCMIGAFILLENILGADLRGQVMAGTGPTR